MRLSCHGVLTGEHPGQPCAGLHNRLRVLGGFTCEQRPLEGEAGLYLVIAQPIDLAEQQLGHRGCESGGRRAQRGVAICRICCGRPGNIEFPLAQQRCGLVLQSQPSDGCVRPGSLHTAVRAADGGVVVTLFECLRGEVGVDPGQKHGVSCR